MLKEFKELTNSVFEHGIFIKKSYFGLESFQHYFAAVPIGIGRHTGTGALISYF